jgi:transketolase
MPNLAVWRPADAIETAEAWSFALKDEKRPSILALSRQNLPPLRYDVTENRSARGAYRLKAAIAPRQPQRPLSGRLPSVRNDARGTYHGAAAVQHLVQYAL